jgi:hypothetical protein
MGISLFDAMNNAPTIYYLYALSGILVVFAGLVIIEIAIVIFNRLAERQQKHTIDQPTVEIRPSSNSSDNPTEEELVAIASALECYYRLYYERLASQITFIRAPEQSAWKAGVNFNQRRIISSNL